MLVTLWSLDLTPLIDFCPISCDSQYHTSPPVPYPPNPLRPRHQPHKTPATQNGPVRAPLLDQNGRGPGVSGSSDHQAGIHWLPGRGGGQVCSIYTWVPIPTSPTPSPVDHKLPLRVLTPLHPRHPAYLEDR